MFVSISQAASFHCAKKISEPIELVICRDPQLGKADEEMSAYYFKISKALNPIAAQELLVEQRAWLKQREKQCPTSIVSSCLFQSYGNRINELKTKYNQIVPLPVQTSVFFHGIRSTCGFPEVTFPKQFKIYAAGNYAGRKLDIQIDDRGSLATQFDVTVNSPDEPVVLLLSAYDPAIWKISWTKGTQILAVMVDGYDRQIVLGIPTETALLISRGGPCESAYISRDNIDSLSRISNKIFNRTTDGIFVAQNGKVVIGAPIKEDEQLFTSSDLMLDDFIDKSEPLAGPLALQKAVEEGFIRKSNGDERQEWRKRWVKSHPSTNKQEKTISSHPLIDTANTYVILKPFHIPSGLHGGNSAVFFLPDGVQFPEGDIGGASLYDMNTLICHGLLCNFPCGGCKD
jgi:uncharacterized protein YecT (DUF1311 family)